MAAPGRLRRMAQEELRHPALEWITLSNIVLTVSSKDFVVST